MTNEKVITHVQNRDGTETGTVVGRGSVCSMDGCGGWRVSVRWPDGTRTRPCTRAMARVSNGLWRIQ